MWAKGLLTVSDGVFLFAGPESCPAPSSNGVGGRGVEGAVVVPSSDVGVTRRDLPPSGTPDAPPIGVPIVTHATRKPSEGRWSDSW